MEQEFSGKVVVVTGASAGIGARVAAQLALRGARLALVARAEQPLRRLADQLCALPLPADLSTDRGCQAVADGVLQHYGRYWTSLP